MIGRAWQTHGEPPIYGSTAWAALEPTDPRWLAAVMRAAEAWRQDGTPQAVVERVVDEERYLARRLRLASYDVAAGTDWNAQASALGQSTRARRRRAAADRGELAA